MSTFKPIVKSNTEGDFCGSLFALADKIKLSHLSVKGVGAEAAHEALGDLYDQVANLADEVTEMIQGYKGILKISIPGSTIQEHIQMLKDERSRITSTMSTMSSMVDVQNKLQDLIGNISRTLYKLENLQ